MASGDSSFPFDNGTANEPEFRRLFEQLGDGIVNDFTGGAFPVSINTATQEVTVGPGSARCASAMLIATLNQVFRLGSTGDQPAAGQTRRDRIVVRTDYAANTVERVLKTGSINQPAPALSSTASGIQEFPLYQVVRTATSTGSTITVIDERQWLGTFLHLQANQPLPALPVGSLIRRSATYFHRQVVAGAVEWVPSNDFDQRAVDSLNKAVLDLEKYNEVRNPARAVFASWEGTGGSWTSQNVRLHVVSIPDPGWPYRLQVSGQIRLGSPTRGTEINARIRVAGGGLDEYDIGTAAQPNVEPGTNLLRWDYPVADQVHTGASRVEVWADRATGSGNGQHDTRNRQLRVARWRA